MKDAVAGAEVEAAIAAFRRLAAADAATKALALVGSRARGSAGPDSDLDLVLLSEDPGRFLGDERWVEALGLPGAIECAPPRPWGAITERRLGLGSDLEIDLGIGAPSWAATEPVDAGTRRVVGDGLRLLHDPDRLLADLAVACGIAARP